MEKNSPFSSFWKKMGYSRCTSPYSVGNVMTLATLSPRFAPWRVITRISLWATLLSTTGWAIRKS